ncbi:MAG: beta-N-acetylhexosaminidase [Pseudomonadota bacterium]
MTLGPLMIDIEGLELSSEDEAILNHPLIGGVILFSRNFHSSEQLQRLIEEIHALRQPSLLVAVDQEGGRIQRFRDGFTALPAPHLVGLRYDSDAKQAKRIARHCGWIMAAELRAIGVDFSFAPVIDLAWGMSEVIGDRAFHRDPRAVGSLGNAFMVGMRKAGMVAVAKHFPGHGAVAADSHSELPVDRRSRADIGEDLLPYERLIAAGLPAIMSGHVVYPAVDDKPATFSAHWLQRELRGRMDFKGVVFSDDLSMSAAASVSENPGERARMALESGCDMAVICNDRDAVHETLDALDGYTNPVSQIRLVRMHGRPMPDADALRRTEQWKKSMNLVTTSFDHAQAELDA